MGDAIAFVGLGAMGHPMARRLLDAGIEVHGYDIAPEARSVLAAAGATVSSDLPETVVGCDIVVCMLPGSDAVEEVMAQIRPVLGAGTLVIDMSSSEPSRTRSLATELAPDIVLIDAPVSGGVAGAHAGTLTIMAGGLQEAIDRALPVLSHLGTVTRAGPVGAGHAVKALNNLLSATHLWVTSEAMHVGRRFGVDIGTMLEIINGSSGRSGSTEHKWPNFIANGTYDSGFTLALMLKDMRIATRLARDVGLPSRLGEQAVDHWAAAADGLPDGADHTEIARWLAPAGE